MVAVRDKIARIPPLVDYDRLSDVVYVSLGRPMPDEGEDRPYGIILRYALKDNRPVGVTVVGFRRNGWDRKLRELSDIIGRHLTIDPSGVLDALEGGTRR